MARASLTRRFADDRFVFPISAIAAGRTARLPGCIELAAANSEFDAGAVAVHSRASRMRHAANRTA